MDIGVLPEILRELMKSGFYRSEHDDRLIGIVSLRMSGVDIG